MYASKMMKEAAINVFNDILTLELASGLLPSVDVDSNSASVEMSLKLNQTESLNIFYSYIFKLFLGNIITKVKNLFLYGLILVIFQNI